MNILSLYYFRFLPNFWGGSLDSGRGGRHSTSVLPGCGAHPASYIMGTGSLPWIKRPELGVNHTSPTRTEVKRRALPPIHLCAFMAGRNVKFTNFWTITRLIDPSAVIQRIKQGSALRRLFLYWSLRMRFPGVLFFTNFCFPMLALFSGFLGIKILRVALQV